MYVCMEVVWELVLNGYLFIEVALLPDMVTRLPFNFFLLSDTPLLRWDSSKTSTYCNVCIRVCILCMHHHIWNLSAKPDRIVSCWLGFRTRSALSPWRPVAIAETPVMCHSARRGGDFPCQLSCKYLLSITVLNTSTRGGILTWVVLVLDCVLIQCMYLLLQLQNLLLLFLYHGVQHHLLNPLRRDGALISGRNRELLLHSCFRWYRFQRAVWAISYIIFYYNCILHTLEEFADVDIEPADKGAEFTYTGALCSRFILGDGITSCWISAAKVCNALWNNIFERIT